MLRVIAEGAERRDQQEFLIEAGVGAAQGFPHLRPVPAEELRTWLDTCADAATRAPTTISAVPVQAAATKPSVNWAAEA